MEECIINIMCVGATKGTYRRNIKMIVNHDYIKQCNISPKKIFWLIILENIVYFLFNRLLHAFIHLNTRISAVLCVHVASSVFFCLTIRRPLRNFAITHLILGLHYCALTNDFSHEIVSHRAAKKKNLIRGQCLAVKGGIKI